MALKYKDVDKEVKDNQAIYKLAMDKGLNIAQARNRYYGQNDALTEAAAVATRKNTPKATNAPTVANYSPSYANNQTQQRTDPTYNQRGWLRAHQNGDKAGEAYYHAAEEANRAALGYSGGEDGSQYIPLMDNYGDFSFQSAPKWFDAYGNQITEQRDKILNRKDFSYNPEEDALYQQLRAQYNREGNRAMKNALGEVSARTGGLASSYAGTAATQANQYYAQQLADRIPELQQLAYSMYMDDLNNDRADLSMLEGASDRDYGRYMDSYGMWSNDRDFAYGDFWNNKNFNYQEGRANVADEQWQKTYDRGVLESDRSYERGVLESDRSYERGVFESDRDYENRIAQQAIENSRARSGGKEESDLLDPEFAAKLLYATPGTYKGAVLSEKAIASYFASGQVDKQTARKMDEQLQAGRTHYDPDWKPTETPDKPSATDILLRPWTLIWGDK